MCVSTGAVDAPIYLQSLCILLMPTVHTALLGSHLPCMHRGVIYSPGPGPRRHLCRAFVAVHHLGQYFATTISILHFPVVKYTAYFLERNGFSQE